MVLESLGCNGLVLSSLCQEQQELVLRYVGMGEREMYLVADDWAPKRGVGLPPSRQ